MATEKRLERALPDGRQWAVSLLGGGGGGGGGGEAWARAKACH
jgi:hypothetical protein